MAITHNRNTGKSMISYLAEKSRKHRKPASATTEELAKAAGISPSAAYSRLWWMENKQAKMVSAGEGFNRRWTLAKPEKAKKAGPAAATETPSTEGN